MNFKEEFVKRYTEYIKVDGSKELLRWLGESDFFKAPASTRFHSSYEGGLVEHSVNVFEQLKKEIELECCSVENSKWSLETIAIVSLLHDLCKVNFYKVSQRNVKDEATGQWHKEPYYSVDDSFPYGHGEKSVYLISKFIRLTDEQAMAVRWHMGGFDTSVKGGSYDVGKAYEKNKLALLLHIADLKATYLSEN